VQRALGWLLRGAKRSSTALARMKRTPRGGLRGAGLGAPDLRAFGDAASSGDDYLVR